jgi:oligopeptide/dipeptide ABC transporter ATP-binding protein
VSGVTDRPAALEVLDLTISVRLKNRGRAKVVDGVSFSVPAGGALGIVGESGSGKTMTSLAILGLLPEVASVDAGRILLDGEDLLTKSEKEMRRLRGSRLSMVLQDPMTALDPSFTIKSQLSDPFRLHRKLQGPELEQAMVRSLEQVHLPAARHRLNQYPHQLSGGMRQRVTSAIALAGEPAVLIADEPTTALDVTTQARYLQLLRELQLSTGFALVLIAHDLMIVRHMCEQVVVMYSGQVVEQGPVGDIFASPSHPYTRALIASVPLIGGSARLGSIDGQAPDISDRITGCRFAARCAYARDVCVSTQPHLLPRDPGTAARCFGTEPDGWIEWRA